MVPPFLAAGAGASPSCRRFVVVVVSWEEDFAAREKNTRCGKRAEEWYRRNDFVVVESAGGVLFELAAKKAPVVAAKPTMCATVAANLSASSALAFPTFTAVAILPVTLAYINPCILSQLVMGNRSPRARGCC